MQWPDMLSHGNSCFVPVYTRWLVIGPILELHLEEFHVDGSHLSPSRFASNRLYFGKCPESSQKPSNCSVRHQCVDNDSWVLGRPAIAKQPIVGDETEKNVESPSNGLRPINYLTIIRSCQFTVPSGKHARKATGVGHIACCANPSWVDYSSLTP